MRHRDQSEHHSAAYPRLRGDLHLTFEEGTWAGWLYDLLPSLSGCNVKKINLAVQPDVWSLHIASIPPKIGISKIVTMTSGHSLQASETSAAPSAAVPTTSNSGDKRAISAASIARLTSANSTRGRSKLCLQGMRRCTPFGLQNGKTGGFKTPAQGYRQQ